MATEGDKGEPFHRRVGLGTAKGGVMVGGWENFKEWRNA